MTQGEHCPVEATLELIGGKYKALILWHLSEHALRFSQLRKLIHGVTPKMLTQQLRELVACIDQAEAKRERQEKPPTLKKVAARGDVDQSILDNANTDVELPDMESDIIP